MVSRAAGVVAPRASLAFGDQQGSGHLLDAGLGGPAAVAAARKQPTPPITTGWLIGIARHKLADHWRRAEREQRGLRLVHAAGGETDDPWDVEIDTVVAHQVLDALGRAPALA